ncbi:hypothetical protein [Rummeliibacillus suwonensis]|uniref:hypothetical protein n=1 Tax=Rummeliibacillus suwonensis TaxID=1306154 RepID=UPI001AAF8798|nr:hypothetical protein [Rummeliibacillus suwonensis]MBO2535680.1 hypothetical protein [Rummeliibacillus suwonensis]
MKIKNKKINFHFELSIPILIELGMIFAYLFMSPSLIRHVISYMCLLISIFLFMAACFLNKFYSKYFPYMPIFYSVGKAIFRLLLLLFAMLFLLLFFIREGVENQSFIFCIILMGPSILIFSMFELFFYLLNDVRKTEKNLQEHPLLNTAIFVFTMIIVMLLPYYVYGESYKLIFDSLSKEYIHQIDTSLEPMHKWDYYYLSFLISYALPIEDPSLSAFIKLINVNPLFRIFEFMHIISIKIVEFAFFSTLVSAIINNFSKMKNP